jgi:hypothetical protein
VAERPWQIVEEVAQAPALPRGQIGRALDLRVSQALSVGAIDRK